MAGSERAGAAAVSGPATPDAYAAIADAFDELAAAGPRRPSKGYHELITALHQSIVQPGSSVLEIGSGGGDLLAALAPAEGVGVDVSPGQVESARARHPELRFEARDGRGRRARPDVRLHRPLRPRPVRRRPRRAVRQRPAPCRRRDADRHPLVQPALAAGAAGARVAAAEVAHADPELGHPPGCRQPASAGRARAGRGDEAHPAAAADPVRVGLLQRLPREPLDHPPPVPHLLDRGPRPADRRAQGAQRLDPRSGQERGRHDRADRRGDAVARHAAAS